MDRKRHRRLIESLEADNRQKEMNLSKMYVDEFRMNIARPLQEEVGDLKNEIAKLKNAIQRINDCDYRGSEIEVGCFLGETLGALASRAFF